jgi:hypothetical protein
MARQPSPIPEALPVTASSYKPRGACPHCGYRMDAGRCPECGRVIALRELALDWHGLRRKRVVRRVGLVIIVLLLGGTGYYLSQSGRWCRCLPTGILLTFQGDEHAPATIELFRRYAAGTMSPRHADRLLDQAMLPPTIDMLDSLPQECGTNLRFKTYLRVPGRFPSSAWLYEWSALDELSEFRVDNGPVVRAAGDGGGDATWRLLDPEAWRCYQGSVGALSPGQHALKWTKVFVLKRVPLDNPSAAVTLHKWTLTATKTITVDSRPPEAHVRPVASSALADEIKHRFQIPDPQPSVDVFAGGVPYRSDLRSIAVAGEAWWRPSGAGAYRRHGELYLPQGYSISTNFFWSPIGITTSQPCVDIRIVPSAKVAVQEGCREYFGDVIELLNVPVVVRNGKIPAPNDRFEIRFSRTADIVNTPTTNQTPGLPIP